MTPARLRISRGYGELLSDGVEIFDPVLLFTWLLISAGYLTLVAVCKYTIRALDVQ